jgi:phage terminase large subunit-like protein
MSKDITIDLMPHQKQLMMSESPVTLFVGGRSCGKSWILGMRIATTLLEGYNVLGVSQSYKTAKLVLLKAVTDALDIIGVKYETNIGDLTLKVGKATLYLFSAQSLEAVRGLTNIRLLAVDEIALCPEEGFNICLATLRGQGAPRVVACTTPRGRHWINKYMNDDSNTIIRATTMSNTFLDDGFVKLLEKQYSDEFYKQEILGEVLNNDAPNQMIPNSLLTNIQNVLPDQPDWKYVIGIDPSRFGVDKTIICVRKGKNIIAHEALDKTNTDQIVELVRKYERKYIKSNISQINFDATGGFHAGAVDELKKTNNNIREINFSGKSPSNNIKNMRTYMYQLAIEYFEAGGCVGYYPELVEQLEAQEYLIGSDGKKGLVPKINIKQKLGISPDDSDAFCLSLITDSDMFTNGLLIKSLQEGQRRLLFKAISDSAGWGS